MLEKALHQIAQGHNPLLPCHGSHDSPSDVEDNKAKASVLGSGPECSTGHSPSLDPVCMAMSQDDSGYQSPVDMNTPTELGNPAKLFEPCKEVPGYQSPVPSKDVNSGVLHSTGQFRKTSTPKSLNVDVTITDSSVPGCHQSPMRQLHFDSLWPVTFTIVSGWPFSNK